MYAILAVPYLLEVEKFKDPLHNASCCYSFFLDTCISTSDAADGALPAKIIYLENPMLEPMNCTTKTVA